MKLILDLATKFVSIIQAFLYETVDKTGSTNSTSWSWRAYIARHVEVPVVEARLTNALEITCRNMGKYWHKAALGTMLIIIPRIIDYVYMLTSANYSLIWKQAERITARLRIASEGLTSFSNTEYHWISKEENGKELPYRSCADFMQRIQSPEGQSCRQ